MASGVEELLGMLYDMIEDGKPVTMHAEQCKIDRDRALDLLDEIRAQFPVELGEAKKLVAAKEDYIANAKREADQLRANAQDQVKRLLNEDQLVMQARDAANDMMRKARKDADQLVEAAKQFCVGIMHDTEAAMGKAADDLHRAQEQFMQQTSSVGGDLYDGE